jgi:hypothetical protein
LCRVLIRLRREPLVFHYVDDLYNELGLLSYDTVQIHMWLLAAPRNVCNLLPDYKLSYSRRQRLKRLTRDYFRQWTHGGRPVTSRKVIHEKEKLWRGGEGGGEVEGLGLYDRQRGLCKKIFIFINVIPLE